MKTLWVPIRYNAKLNRNVPDIPVDSEGLPDLEKLGGYCRTECPVEIRADRPDRGRPAVTMCRVTVGDDKHIATAAEPSDQDFAVLTVCQVPCKDSRMDHAGALAAFREIGRRVHPATGKAAMAKALAEARRRGLDLKTEGDIVVEHGLDVAEVRRRLEE